MTGEVFISQRLLKIETNFKNDIGNSDENRFIYQYFLFDISPTTIVIKSIYINPALRSSMIHDFGFT